ncbi:MAG TPA: patatin-like phospholipase family protein [Vicinamibacteria bacterium]
MVKTRRRAPRRTRSGKPSKVALVCAGGGITGAVYEIGCLRALEDLLDRSVTDLDLYVGVSGGAFVTSLLANDISPREMYDAIAAPRRGSLTDPTGTLFRVGLGEFWRRSLRAPRVVTDALLARFGGEGGSWSDVAWALFELLPAGLLDNSGIEEYLSTLFAAGGRSNDFARLARPLHVIAVDLDSGEAVDFGPGGDVTVPVSKAVQASTALPGLYRPVRIGRRDYVDGGVKKTAHINLAIQSGADLVICVNPIVPIDNRSGALSSHLSSKGITYVLDQVLRIALHGRMQYGLERYQAEHPEVDILLLEPTRDDLRMFSYNIMRYSARKIVAAHAYRSTLQAFTVHEDEYRRLLRRHGIALRDPRRLPHAPEVSARGSSLARALSGSLDVLSSALRRNAG